MSDNRGSCYGLGCVCQDFYGDKHLSGDYHCQCGHSELCHYYKSNGFDTKSSQPPMVKSASYAEPTDEDEAVEVPDEPAKPSKVPSEAVERTLTPKEARALLVKHGVQVGQRGRLDSSQWAKAEELAKL